MLLFGFNFSKIYQSRNKLDPGWGGTQFVWEEMSRSAPLRAGRQESGAMAELWLSPGSGVRVAPPPHAAPICAAPGQLQEGSAELTGKLCLHRVV